MRTGQASKQAPQSVDAKGSVERFSIPSSIGVRIAPIGPG